MSHDDSKTPDPVPLPDAVTSVALGPEVAPSVRQCHFELADGSDGYGYVRKPQEGAPMRPGERLIDLHEADERGRFRAVERFRNGPARVASPAYREGWDAIFGKKDLN